MAVEGAAGSTAAVSVGRTPPCLPPLGLTRVPVGLTLGAPASVGPSNAPVNDPVGISKEPVNEPVGRS